jgi:hypothetical protein
MTMVKKVRRWSDLSLPEKVMWGPLRLFAFLLDKSIKWMKWLAPGITQELIYLPNTKTMKTVPVLPDTNWRMVTSFAWSLFPIILWGTTALLVEGMGIRMIYLGLAVVSGFHFFVMLKTLVVLLNWSPIVVGERTGDEGDITTERAFAMLENAKERNIKMKLMLRNNVLRAYFPNDDDATMIKLST